MDIVRRIGGFAILFLFVFSSCMKEVSYYEEEIPEGRIVMKNQVPQRVSDQMILEIVDINDSRCPVGVVCSTTGEVGIEFKAYINGAFSNLEMSYDQMFNNEGCSTTFEGHVINILKVSPHPYDGEEIALGRYAIEIQVEKL